MIKTRRYLLWPAVIMLLGGLLGPAAPAFSAGRPRLAPQLAQLAAAAPQQWVAVIVQKADHSTAAEQQAARLGGQVTQALSLINAFAAEMTAGAARELALSPAVRWVSPDAPTHSTQASDEFTTWATQLGSAGSHFFGTYTAMDSAAATTATDSAAADSSLASTSSVDSFSASAQFGRRPGGSFINPSLIVDSALGPNGTYGAGGKAQAAFTGFAEQAVPGYAIGKVEIVLNAYVPVAISAGQDPSLTVYVGGHAGATVVLDHSALNGHIGAANAGPIYVDVTGTRAWQWADFDNDLEISVDQSRFGGSQVVDYDAVGLRINSAPGADAPADTGGDTSADTTVDTSQQANVYNQVIGATALWNNAHKLQGKGIGIAIVDSGVFRTQDLGRRVRANVNFNGAYHDAADRYGHGTFVAGIAAGNGSQSGNKYIGVAPRADVINVRVSDDQGMAYESDVVRGLQWVLDNRARYNIRVVNLSLNSSVAATYDTSPLDAACEVLWFNGLTVVAAAGNNGSATLYAPANDPFVITVGATNDAGTASLADDAVAAFSAHGVTDGGTVKPDLVAPGTHIIGLLPENDKLKISKDHGNNRVDVTYFRMSGTSVSAPMVSGAVALLLQDEPGLNPDQVKYRLMATANKSWAGYTPDQAGAGYLDVAAAVNGTTTQAANSNQPASQLLWTGASPVNWDSVNWNSVNWNSVNWNSVNWNSVNWNSVNWNSDYWGQ